MLSDRQIVYMITGKRPPRRSPRRRTGAGRPARNYKYRAWIRSLPSAVSGAPGCEACHTGPHGIGTKASDYSCIPLTHLEHMRLHAIGQAQFESLHGLDIAGLVRRLNHDWFAYSKEVK